MKIGEFVVIPTGAFAGQLGEIVEILPKVIKVQVGQLRVGVDPAILDATEKAEAEAEADARRPHKTRREEDGKPKDKKPRNRNTKAEPPLIPQPEPTPTPTVTQTKERIKKEEPKVERTIVTKPVTPATPTRVEPLYCPVCPPGDQPKLRRKATDLVCGDCYRQYTNEAAIALARGNFQNIFDWVVSKASAILITLEEQYISAKAEVGKLQKQVGDETFASLKRNTGGKEVPKEIWDTAFRTKKQELWRANGGNVKFAKMKGLESRIALLKSILEKSKEPKPAPPAVTPPAPPAEPASKPAEKRTPVRRVKPTAKKTTTKKEAATK